MYRINLKTVDALVHQVIGEVAQRVREYTQQDVGHTHTTLNGMFPAVPTAQQAARPLELIENSLQFKALAFGLPRMRYKVFALFWSCAIKNIADYAYI